jgi:hypothetical protein
MNNYLRGFSQRCPLGVTFCLLFLAIFLSVSTSEGRDVLAPNQLKTYSKEKRSNYAIVKEPGVTYFGIVPRALEMSKPYELISPFASKSYGYGRDMTSWSASSGKPKGFIVAGIRFW